MIDRDTPRRPTNPGLAIAVTALTALTALPLLLGSAEVRARDPLWDDLPWQERVGPECGWICQMTALWLAFRAIGIELRTTFILIIVPIATIAGVTPLPGGAGGIETVLVFLLLAAPLPHVTEAIAVTAVVIFRGAIYWVPVILGGGVVAWISSGANIGSPN